MKKSAVFVVVVSCMAAIFSSISFVFAETKEIPITEENFNLLEGRWVGVVKAFTIKSGTLEYTASLDIKTGDKKVVLGLGRSNIFERGIFKDGCFICEKKKTGEWIKIALVESNKIKVEFEIENKNPTLANIKGEGLFVPFQK